MNGWIFCGGVDVKDVARRKVCQRVEIDVDGDVAESRTQESLKSRLLCKISPEHEAARVAVALVLIPCAGVVHVNAGGKFFVVVSDFENGGGAFVVNAVSEFGDTLFNELWQLAEEVDVCRPNGVIEFVSECAVEQGRGA